MAKEIQAYRTIGEVSDIVGVPTHVLRFWEGKFTQVKPVKRRGGHRYYKQSDIEVLTTIQDLLHNKGFTIKGAKKFIAEGGISAPVNTSSTEIKEVIKEVIVEKEVTNKPKMEASANDNEFHKELLEIRDILTA